MSIEAYFFAENGSRAERVLSVQRGDIGYLPELSPEIGTNWFAIRRYEYQLGGGGNVSRIPEVYIEDFIRDETRVSSDEIETTELLPGLNVIRDVKMHNQSGRLAIHLAAEDADFKNNVD